MPELMSEVLWSRIGAQCDATIGVDAAGTGFFDGGISACLTDMIRFGSLLLRDGVSLTGQQVVPAAWIADTLDGGPTRVRRSPRAPTTTECPAGCTATRCGFPTPATKWCCVLVCAVR
ncbi:putative 6-aminohexanoate-dimer hydrolase domain protein [Mycobacterium xenopi 4042]|uniref:Putative 6-aminohexanoate-dimer hydrolase domain protein n=1 Tax=Mycobacterium xenopi 4042 TaxID=1299334 RepID=X8BES4_MYCXE|nr:putative 6-aminohexanoate-dimer hydrolase domain protein [Mycobacterium xenopi 4042]